MDKTTESGWARFYAEEEARKREQEIHRTERNRLAEAFIRGIEIGAEFPSLAGDGDAMYEAFRQWKGDF